MIPGFNVTSFLEYFMANPMLLALGLIIATFILEDAATTTGAFLASQAVLPPWLAFGAVICGIIIGDTVIYTLGYSARKHPRVKAWLQRKNLLPDIEVIDRHMAIAVVTARFLPGFRFPTYIMAGFLRMSLFLYLGIIVVAIGIWTSLLFYLVYQLGEAVMHIPAYYLFALYIVVIAAIYCGMPKITKYIKARRVAKAVQKMVHHETMQINKLDK